jgi:hypothetical protein
MFHCGEFLEEQAASLFVELHTQSLLHDCADLDESSGACFAFLLAGPGEQLTFACFQLFLLSGEPVDPLLQRVIHDDVSLPLMFSPVPPA